MYASTITVTMRPDMHNEGIAFAHAVTAQLTELNGIREYTAIETGENTMLVIVIYDSQQDWETAAPTAQSILGGMADMVAAPPQRVGGEVIINHVY